MLVKVAYLLKGVLKQFIVFFFRLYTVEVAVNLVLAAIANKVPYTINRAFL